MKKAFYILFLFLLVLSSNIFAIETNKAERTSNILRKNIFREENNQSQKDCMTIDEKIKEHIIVIGDSCSVKKEISINITNFITNFIDSTKTISSDLNINLNFGEEFDIIVIYVPRKDSIDKNKKHGEEYNYLPVVIIDFKKDLFFDFNSSKLKKTGYSIIYHFVNNVILSSSNYNIITVIGHADNVGDEKSNYELSKKRSDATVAEIQRQINFSDFSVDSFTIESVGAGETQPIERFSQETKSQVNRRIDILFSTSSYAMYAAKKYIQCVYKNDFKYRNCFDKYLSKQKMLR
jgi:outer membrane protein OmpA-like peptidoglycan-associated protein